MKLIFCKLMLLLAILLVVSSKLYSQKSEWKTHQIKFSPIRAVNMFSPGLELSYELNYSNFSTQIAAAYLVDIFTTVPRGSNLSGYRLGLEEKYFIKTFKRKIRMYLSAEYIYSEVDMTLDAYFIPYEYLHEGWEIQEANSYWGYCDLNRKSNIINAKYGVQFAWGCFTLDAAVGLGIMHQNVKHFNKVNPKDKYNAHFEDIITPLFYDEGRYFIFNLPIAVKVGFVF